MKRGTRRYGFTLIKCIGLEINFQKGSIFNPLIWVDKVSNRKNKVNEEQELELYGITKVKIYHQFTSIHLKNSKWVRDNTSQSIN